MAIMTLAGHVGIASALHALPWHLAWGTGNAAWDATPVPASAGLTALTAEIGRYTATQVAYCTPDAGGILNFPSGRYAFSVTPTRYLYFKFHFENGPVYTIREAGLFMGTVPITGLPPGQRFFTPAQIQTPGTLLIVERFPAYTRAPSALEAVHFVLTF